MVRNLVGKKVKTWFKIITILFVSPFLFSQPYSISNLVATSGLADLQEGSIKLTWTYPGPDVLPTGSKYYIQYSTFTEISWSTGSAQVVISTGPVNVGENQVYVLTGLDNFIKNNSLSKDTTFYFVIWTSSSTEELLSGVSNVATGWLTLWYPYANFTSCGQGEREGEIYLQFQGCDDYINGTLTNALTGYWYIQYSTDEYSTEWSTANAQVVIATHTYPSYQWYAGWTITGLISGVTYYFRLWAEDDLGNVSDISNCATTYAQVDISAPRPVTCIKVSYGFRHVNLEWTIPQEDSYSDGFLYNSSSYTGCYEIRYRNDQQISDESLWSQATSFVVIGPTELTPFSSTTTVITGLTNFTSYYFAIKVADERYNWSQIGAVTIGGVVFQSSSPFCQPINSPPQAVNPQNHFVYDPELNSTATVISSTTVKIDWSLASWYPGYSYSDSTYDNADSYGDYISSYTVRIATYTVDFSLGVPTITFSGITLTSVTVYNLNEDTTYYWDLTCYDSESLSSTTVVFKFVINSTNSAPVFPANPLLSPTTVWHTTTSAITFSWLSAVDPDPFDFVVGYRIYISSNSSDWYPIPLQGYIVTNSTTVITQDLYCYSLFLDAENNKIYWYVIAYDSGAPLGYSQQSIQTPTTSFWLNQVDSPPADFEVYFPSGTRVLVENATYYKVIIDGTTYYPIMEKILDGTTYYIAKSTPIILAWQPTSDPDPEDGVYEYAIFITSTPSPETGASNGWRYVTNPQNEAPYESNYWFSQWNFFTSTSITKMVEEGTQEGYNLVLLENTSYYWRVRALDSYRTSYWIWDTTSTFSPSLEKGAAMFIIDFTSEPPSGYDVVAPTGIINPQSLGQLYFDWTDAIDPDPFDSLKYYFISVTTVYPQDTDEWFTLPAPLWKINTWLGENTVSSTTLMFTNPQLTPGVTYFWQVHSWGKQEWDYAVNPSTSQPYRVKPYGIATTTGVFVVSNQKPYKFNLISPGTTTAAGIVYVKTYRPTFYWEQVYDPDNYDPVVSSYVVVISSGSDFSFAYQIFTSTTSLVLDFNLQPRTTYYWYVVAYDKYCNFELPYSTFYFKIENFEPNMFDLVDPTNDAVVATLKPTFQFQNKSDPDGDTVYYTIQYSSYSDFSVYESSSGWSNLDADTTMYIPSPWEFEENQQYFWRIIADDTFGGVITSTVSSFWVNSVEEPPNSFYVNITSGVITQKDVNFSWGSTDDPDPKDYVVYYKLCISSVPNYVVGVSTYVIIYGSTTTNYIFDISSLTENAVYCWWVEAYDKTGLYRKSNSSYTFIVDLSTEPPDDVYLYWPGSSTDFVRVSSQIVTFVWAAGNKTEWWKSIDYILYLSSSNNVYTFNITSGPYTNWYEADKIYFSTGPLIENTTYFWWVKVLNSSGVKTSVTFYFFYDTTNNPPSVFDLLTPSGTVNTRLPEFKWVQTTDPDDNVSHYVVYYSTRSDFVVTSTTTVFYPWNSFTPQMKLQMNTTYYWKVEAYDTRGSSTTSKQIWWFYVPNLKPLPVTNIQPQGNISTRKPRISWLPQGHMDYKGVITNYKLTLYNQNYQIIFSTLTGGATEYFMEQNLVQNVTYYITVSAIDDDNVEGDSVTVSLFVLPVNIPQRVTIKDFNIDKITTQKFKITITWSEVNKYVDGTLADDIVGYNIYRSTNFDSLYSYKLCLSTVTSFSEYITTEIVYYYGIKTVTIGGVESDPPEEVLSTFAEGSRILVSSDTKIIVPSNVYSEVKNAGGEIRIVSYPVENQEVEYLGVVKKCKVEFIQNGQTKEYKFTSPIILEFDKTKVLQHARMKLTNTLNVNDKLKPAVFYHNKVEYVYVHTEYDENNLRSKILQSGLYAIRYVNLPDRAQIVNIVPKKIFTPAIAQDNEIQFYIYNPTTEQPEGEIYDLDLRYVAKLKYDGVNILSWDGKYEDGTIVPKGVYIYRIKLGDKTFTGSVIVAK